MARAGLELFWAEATAGSGDNGVTGDAKSGFVALYRVGGTPLAFVPALGGADAKGYGQSADVRLVGAEVRTLGKHTVITVRWEERTRVYSTGMGGTVDRRDLVSAVCTIDGRPSCPFVRPTETDISVLGGQGRDEQEAWKLDIAGDGWLTATPVRSSGHAKRDEGAEPLSEDFVKRNPCPIRVRLWPV